MIKSRRMRWMKNVACMGNTGNAYRGFVGTAKGKGPPGISRFRIDNVKIDIKESGWEGVDWIHLAQDRDQWQALVNIVMDLHIP
jgi:hypothetical protein